MMSGEEDRVSFKDGSAFVSGWEETVILGPAQMAGSGVCRSTRDRTTRFIILAGLALAVPPCVMAVMALAPGRVIAAAAQALLY